MGILNQTKLSVNINKLATIRNARGGNNPDILLMAKKIESYGAHGITVHPRPDQRHIRFSDVYALKDILSTEFNIEGYPDKRYLQLIKDLQPAQATLVPDPPSVLTSNAGWDCNKQAKFLEPIIAQIQAMGIRVSLYMETDLVQIDKAKALGADRIELYTGPYAELYTENRVTAIEPYRVAALHAHNLGLGINAGHDLSLTRITKLCSFD